MQETAEELIYNASELIQLCDEQGRPTGAMERERAHLEGKRHLVVHLWLLCEERNGKHLYFQQRSLQKRAQPGMYDLASTGHVSAGETPLCAALREANEEIGLFPQQELSFLGRTKEGGAPLLEGGFDREVCAVFLCHIKGAPCLHPGPEVLRIVKVSLEDYIFFENGGRAVAGRDAATGESLLLKREAFCPHPGEFAKLVLPKVYREGS